MNLDTILEELIEEIVGWHNGIQDLFIIIHEHDMGDVKIKLK